MVAGFEWLSRADDVPARWDLRLVGWERHRGQLALPRLYDGRAQSRCGDWRALAQPRMVGAIGIDCPQERAAMLADVWRLAHVPETNSLEVHVSRLRAKLAPARAGWLVETDPRGGYRLAGRSRDARWTPPAPFTTIAAT